MLPAVPGFHLCRKSRLRITRHPMAGAAHHLCPEGAQELLWPRASAQESPQVPPRLCAGPTRHTSTACPSREKRGTGRPEPTYTPEGEALPSRSPQPWQGGQSPSGCGQPAPAGGQEGLSGCQQQCRFQLFPRTGLPQDGHSCLHRDTHPGQAGLSLLAARQPASV